MSCFPELIWTKVNRYLVNDNLTLLQLRTVKRDLTPIIVKSLTFSLKWSHHLYLRRKEPDFIWAGYLGDFYQLNLSFGPYLEDVSQLKNVHILNLSWCTRLEDVSPLGNQHTLILRGCARIRDVSHLSRVNTLDISECNGLINIRSQLIKLRDVPHLKADYCLSFEDHNLL